MSEILLINENMEVLNAGRDMLRHAGYAPHTAVSMREALSILSSNPIELILSGLALEENPASTLLTYLKNDPLRETIPFVFFIHTENQADFRPMHALAMGAADIIMYPIKAEDFISRIHEVLPPSPGKSRSMPESGESESTTGQGAATAKANVSPGHTDAEVCCGNKPWTPCRILNTTAQGAMVETILNATQGASVQLRYCLDDEQVVVTGKITHILLGDDAENMGFGIHMGIEKKWREIHYILKAKRKSSRAAAEKTPVPPPASPPPRQEPASTAEPAKDPTTVLRPLPSPVTIEVSLDGVLWMQGEITDYGENAATIKTPILGKIGIAIHIRCVLIHGSRSVQGEIIAVSLNDMKMPVGMTVRYATDSEWRHIHDFIDNFKDSLSIRPHEVRSDDPAKAEGKIEDGAPPATEQENQWLETVALTHIPQNTPEKNADNGKNGKKDIKTRFYNSLIGKQMDNHQIVSLISSGGMGGVFKAWDIALERDVALKVISYDLSSQNEFVEMFFKEARFISQVNHPNVVQIYTISKSDNILYYAMEFIRGKTLAELIKAQGGISLEKCTRYLISICKALDFLQGKNILHRDIKPANIMITAKEAIKIVDFGVAQKQTKGQHDTPQSIVGSPLYLSPEMIQEQPMDHRSDIYSLGITFYHALAGTPPYMDQTIKGILDQHLHSTPVPLDLKFPHMPMDLCNIIEKMMAKHPEDRFQNYQEIIDRLKPFA